MIILVDTSKYRKVCGTRPSNTKATWTFEIGDKTFSKRGKYQSVVDQAKEVAREMGLIVVHLVA